MIEVALFVGGFILGTLVYRYWLTRKAKLVFADWRIKEESIYHTGTGWELSRGDLHSGTTFAVRIEMDADTYDEIKRAMKNNGANPVFGFFVE